MVQPWGRLIPIQYYLSLGQFLKRFIKGKKSVLQDEGNGNFI